MKNTSVSRVGLAAVAGSLCLVIGGLDAAAQSYFLQPGPSGTKDTWVSEQDDFDHGSWGTLQANQDQFGQRILIQFDLSGIAEPVMSAYLGLYRFEAFDGSGMTLNAYPVTQAWSQGVGWSAQPTSEGLAAASASVSGTTPGWVEWNITALVQAWMDGSRENFGLMIYAPDAGSAGFQRFVSSNNETASQPTTAFPRDPALQPYIRGLFVPEPSAFALLALGLTAFAVARPRRRA